MLFKADTKDQQFKTVFLLLLLTWGCINGLQSILTEIGEDEAYYWMYARILDWGYFDHPPMIALFVKTGISVCKGSLGIRLITILAQLLCLLTIWRIIDDPSPTVKKVTTFFIIAASVVMFQVFGFIATPDSPLLLFTALFLAAYKQFLKEENTVSFILLSLTMAGLMYSKYHGALIILCIIASNPRLLLSSRFWLSGILALILFSPHILWQLHHEFPSLQYHLISRSGGFKLKNILNYFPSQLANFSPFFLLLFIFLAVKFKAKDMFEKGLFFVIWGFLIVFFFSAFRGHVEPHWTISASIPMIILVYRKSQLHTGSMKYIYRILLPSIGLLMLARIVLAIDFLPVETDFHGPETHYKALGEATGNMPVVFESTYQSPSLFTYNAGKPSTTVNGLAYRKNQYDIWDIEASMANQTIVFVPNNPVYTGTPHTLPNGEIENWIVIDSFIPVQKVCLKTDFAAEKLVVGDTVSLPVMISNPYDIDIPLHRTDRPIAIHAMLLANGRVVASVPMQLNPDTQNIPKENTLTVTGAFVVPELPPGTYAFGMSVKAIPFPETFNSLFSSVEIVN